MYTLSHSLNEETPEAKARWFQSLTLAERMDYLCAVTDLVLENNPKVAERKDAQPTSGRICVLTSPDLIASKRAAGRPKDLDDVRMLAPGQDEPTEPGPV